MGEIGQAAANRYAPWACVCRWGIVLVAMTLVPGAAFLGQGIGRWLRTRSESGWAPQAVRVQLGRRGYGVPQGQELTAVPPADRPARPEESAAMYDGGLESAPIEASLADFEEVTSPSGNAADFVPTTHREVASQRDASTGFAELERRLQELGAVYYALEVDRASDYSYRFVCIMPATEGRGAQERFTSPGRTAVEAVEAVLRQVAEQHGRQP